MLLIIIKIVIFLAITGGFVLAWRIESGWKIILTPFLFVAYFEFFRIIPPFFVADIYAGIDTLLPILVASLAYGSLIVGFLLTNYLRGGRRSTASAFSVNVQPHLQFSKEGDRRILLLVLFLSLVGLIFYGGLPSPVQAVYHMVTGASDSAGMVSQQRFLLTKGAYFGGEYRGQGLNAAIQFAGWMLVLSYMVIRWEQFRSRKSFFLLVASVLLSWMFVAGDGTRGQFLNLLIIGVAAYSLRRPLKPRAVLVVVAAAFVIAAALSLYSNKSAQVFSGDSAVLANAATKIGERIFLSNGISDVYVIDLVQKGYFDLRLGANHYRDFLAALPFVQAPPPLSYEVYLAFNPQGKGTTFLSGTYISAAYIDFGVIGIPILFFLAGATIGYFEYRLFRASPRPWDLCVRMVSATLAANIVSVGFIGFFANLAVLLVLAFLMRVTGSVFSARRYLRHAGPSVPTKL